MKNKKKILMMIILFVLIILGIILLFGFISFGKRSNIQEVQNGVISNQHLKTGLQLTSGKIEKIDDYYHIIMIATNDTLKKIDMSNYRISFIDENGEEIEYLRGTAIGILSPGESREFVIDSPQDLSRIKKIQYEKFPYAD